ALVPFAEHERRPVAGRAWPALPWPDARACHGARAGQGRRAGSRRRPPGRAPVRAVDTPRTARQTARSVDPDLHAFVRDALTRGAGRDEIRKALRDARWPEDEIESELAAWHDAGLPLPVPRRRVGLSPREAFLYLLMFVALYLVAYHTGSVFWALAERTWPDAAVDDRVWDRMSGSMRFSVGCVLGAG